MPDLFTLPDHFWESILEIQLMRVTSYKLHVASCTLQTGFDLE